MPRINVLTGETPPPTLEAPPAKKKRAAAPRKSILPARDSVIPVHPLLAAITELPDSIFAFLTGKTDGDFKP